MSKKTVIGLLGSTLDNTGKGSQRWERWRPSVSLFQHEELLVERFDLLYQQEFQSLFEVTAADIRSVSPETTIVPHLIALDNPWDFEEVFAVLHDFALAYPFGQENEYLVHITTGSHVAQICMFLLTEARYFPAKLVQTGPGRGRKNQAAGSYSIIDLDLSCYDRIATRFHQERDDDISFLKSGIATRNPDFNRMIEQIEQVAARTVDPILLSGPTGAGKSRLARRVYELKKNRRRLSGAFVEVNCATLRGENAMAALFGHTKGAFTGAVSARPGLLRTADKGLLFLDEIGELGLDEQAMLLRAIEEKRFLPVGADSETESDFQLICGSNRNLGAECCRGAFRDDLLARINLWTFTLPGLRQRPEDLEPNLDYELARFSGRTGSQVTINREARRMFLDFATSAEAVWSANFRDLGGAVTRMATLAPQGRITVDGVREEVDRLRARWEGGAEQAGDAGLLRGVLGEGIDDLDLFDRITLTEVIRVCRAAPSLSGAGRSLFGVSRLKKKNANDSDRLRKYLARFGLDWQQVRGRHGWSEGAE